MRSLCPRALTSADRDQIVDCVVPGERRRFPDAGLPPFRRRPSARKRAQAISGCARPAPSPRRPKVPGPASRWPRPRRECAASGGLRVRSKIAAASSGARPERRRPRPARRKESARRVPWRARSGRSRASWDWRGRISWRGKMSRPSVRPRKGTRSDGPSPRPWSCAGNECAACEPFREAVRGVSERCRLSGCGHVDLLRVDRCEQFVQRAVCGAKRQTGRLCTEPLTPARGDFRARAVIVRNPAPACESCPLPCTINILKCSAARRWRIIFFTLARDLRLQARASLRRNYIYVAWVVIGRTSVCAVSDQRP